MAKQSFLLVSLQEDKAKKLAQAVSNESCRRVLDYLTEKGATETELSQKLQLPMSTVHYNLKQLVDAGLVSADEFHYSKKGKEVIHYKLANKYIIIAPKSTFGIKEKLRSILPVVLIVSVATLMLQFTQNLFARGSVTKIFSSSKQLLVRETVISPQVVEPTGAIQEVSKSVAVSSIKQASDGITNATQIQLINKTTEYMTSPVVTTQTVITPSSFWANIALWFLLGAVFALLVYMVVSSIRKDIK